MKPRHRRLLMIVLALGALATATGLVLRALSANVMFFFSPSQVQAQQAPRHAAFRLGGLVEPQSLKRGGDNMNVRFVVTDNAHRVPVQYRGILPDLFKEGKGVVASGRLDEQGNFVATEVLAKHDENYMPPEAAAALADAHRTGVGQGQTGGREGAQHLRAQAHTPVSNGVVEQTPTQTPTTTVRGGLHP